MKFEKRTKLFSYFIILFFILVAIKLFQLQILDGNYFKRLSFKQSYQLEKDTPARGIIYSSDQFPISSNQTVYQISLYKPNIEDISYTKKLIIDTISNLVDTDKNLINSFIDNPDQKWITLKTYLNQDQYLLLANHQGLVVKQVEQRFYPEEGLFANILGVLAKNINGANTGYGGLEGFYNQQIEGKSGFSWQSKDAIGQPVFTQLNWRNPKIDGFDLHTSLNRHLQFIVGNELQKSLVKTQANLAIAIVMESQTGSILAMATKHASPSAITKLSNPAIASLYEPGSIFKPLTVAIGLDSQSIRPDFTCSICHQDRLIDDHQISNWDFAHHPNSDLKQIIKNSDNIAMTEVMDQIDLDTFLEYANLLGLNKKTGIDLQGESKPNFDKNYWSKIEKATAAFGQGFAVTPIQVIQAFNAIATDGYLFSPHVVNYIDNHQNKKEIKIKNKKVFDQQTTKQIKELLEYNIKNSNLAKLNINKLDVCGKSGTAQVANHGIYGQDTIASFIAFSPCQQPKYTMLVIIDTPKSSPWGSTTAAPAWFNIANKMEFFIKML